jgi:hypothetical protein
MEFIQEYFLGEGIEVSIFEVNDTSNFATFVSRLI